MSTFSSKRTPILFLLSVWLFIENCSSITPAALVSEGVDKVIIEIRTAARARFIFELYRRDWPIQAFFLNPAGHFGDTALTFFVVFPLTQVIVDFFFATATGAAETAGAGVATAEGS